MLSRMYLWELVGRDAREGSPRSGIGGDLGRVMRAVEAELVEFPGFDGRVSEVVPRISVASLGTVYVPTGREWLELTNPLKGATQIAFHPDGHRLLLASACAVCVWDGTPWSD